MKSADASSEAHVARVGFEVAHDSEGLALVTLRHPNGAETTLPLEGRVLERVAIALGLASLEDLVGVPFSAIAKALPANAAPADAGT